MQLKSATEELEPLGPLGRRQHARINNAKAGEAEQEDPWSSLDIQPYQSQKLQWKAIGSLAHTQVHIHEHIHHTRIPTHMKTYTIHICHTGTHMYTQKDIYHMQEHMRTHTHGHMHTRLKRKTKLFDCTDHICCCLLSTYIWALEGPFLGSLLALFLGELFSVS